MKYTDTFHFANKKLRIRFIRLGHELKKEWRSLVRFGLIAWVLIILSTLIVGGCASTLEFLFKVDPDLTYNNQEEKWEQKQK